MAEHQLQKRTGWLTCALVLSGLLTACAPDAVGDSITNIELAASIDEDDAPFILDVRTSEEFSEGHVPGAVNVPHTTLADRLAELPDAGSERIVVYCHSGKRAQMATDLLQANGYTGIMELEGHMSGWREAGLPID